MTRVPLALIAIAAPIAAADPITRLIDPTLTSPDIQPIEFFQEPNVPDTRHRVVIDLDAPRANRLFLFLAGSGGLPANYNLIVRKAAEMGYQAIGLTYPNDPSVKDLMVGETDPDLPELIRRERLFGENLSTKVDVDPANAIQGRLVALLTYLDGLHPNEGWGSYLTITNEPRWGRVVASGHSQGAGHAAFLTKTAELAGVVMFAGPGDFVPDQGQAPWLFTASLTPTRRLLAFTHQDDPTAGAFFINQNTLGLNDVTPPQFVDGLGPFDIYAQALISDLASVPVQDAHGAPVVDARTPIGPGPTIIYEPIWEAMLAQFIPDPCPGDVNADGLVDVFDFAELAAGFGAFPAPRIEGDLNRDATVDVFDFAILAARFGADCAAD